MLRLGFIHISIDILPTVLVLTRVSSMNIWMHPCFFRRIGTAFAWIHENFRLSDSSLQLFSIAIQEYKNVARFADLRPSDIVSIPVQSLIIRAVMQADRT